MWRLALQLIVLLAESGLVFAQGSLEPSTWQGKVHPAVLAEAARGPVEFIVVLREAADLGPALQQRTKLERGTHAYQLLREVSSRTQAPLRSLLAAYQAEFKPFWIANLIWVRADAEVLASLARRAEVLRIDPNPRVRLQWQHEPPGPAGTSGIEWNIEHVHAPQVWSLDYEGQGVVVGGQDTGYQWDHPAIISQYRGWNGTSADHDYNWHDAIHSAGGVCGADSQQPCDDSGHGTHTMGTMVGDDGGANRIGMSPAARWIGCRNMDQGFGTPATYTECFQWFVAPTDLSGANPDPAKAPHVINNSWGCPPFEGCAQDTLRQVVENTRAAGIVVVASAGNSGNNCSTVHDPPAHYDASFTVGATNSSDGIASFSSRGPVTVDGSNRLKPDISAPGVGIRSSVPTGGYGNSSGTSMAGPHVAGLVALLLSARPDLEGHVEEIEQIIERAALPLTSSQGCGGDSTTMVPNNTFGYGRIEALQCLTGDADGDGATNLVDCRPTDGSVWAAPLPATNLRLAQETETMLSWSPPQLPGGNLLTYDLLRSKAAGDFSAAVCLVSGAAGTTATDSAGPAQVFFYLVRARNTCGSHLGSSSSGALRTGASCP